MEGVPTSHKTDHQLSSQSTTKSKSDVKREKFALEKSKSNLGQGSAKYKDIETASHRSSSMSDKSSDFDPSVYDDTPSEKSVANSLETMPIVFRFK